MKVGLAQIAIHKADIQKNIDIHKFWIGKAAVHNLDFIIFPELSISGYEPELAKELATNKNDKRFDIFQKLSNDNNLIICIGCPTQKSNSKLYISLLIFQPNKERSCYSKMHIHSSEKAIFSPGQESMVLKFNNHIIAPTICYEISSKSHQQYAKEQKADIFVASVFNTVEGVSPDLIKLSRIAKENNCIAMVSNYVGITNGKISGGRSSIWNKKGQLQDQLDAKEEGILMYDTETAVATKIY